MSETYISADLRRLVVERASKCCEYCFISQADSFLPFEIDHIISEKHRGKTNADNLCLSCPDCNAYKGSDIGSIDPETGQLTFLYNPRTQKWSDHFHMDGIIIQPLTPEGRVTVLLLQINHPDRIAERNVMAQLGRYPPST
jgi:hypothetical protein